MPDFAYLAEEEDASRELIHESVLAHIVDTDDVFHNRVERVFGVSQRVERSGRAR